MGNGINCACVADSQEEKDENSAGIVQIEDGAAISEPSAAKVKRVSHAGVDEAWYHRENDEPEGAYASILNSTNSAHYSKRISKATARKGRRKSTIKTLSALMGAAEGIEPEDNDQSNFEFSFRESGRWLQQEEDEMALDLRETSLKRISPAGSVCMTNAANVTLRKSKSTGDLPDPPHSLSRSANKKRSGTVHGVSYTKLSLYTGQSENSTTDSETDSPCPDKDEASDDEQGRIIPTARIRKSIAVRRSESMCLEESTQTKQIIVQNPRNINDVYDLTTKEQGASGFTNRARSGKEATSALQGTVKATGAVRAVKSIKKQVVKEAFGEDLSMLRTEVQVTQMVDHPHIVKLYEIFEDALNVDLVMEDCVGGTLHARVTQHGKLSEKHAAVAMQQIVTAVLYLHQHSICHRDIRPANVLLSTADVDIIKNRLKLTDFGVSCMFEPGRILRGRVGTPEFMSPQVIKRSYTEKSDIWSCGVTMYCLYTCGLPFCAENYVDLHKRILNGKYSFGSGWEAASKEMLEFQQQLLASEEKSRPSAEEAVKSSWIKIHVKPPKNAAAMKADLYLNLTAFKKMCKFGRQSLCLIASYLNKSQISDAEDAFRCLDENGDGVVTAEECKVRIQSMLSKSTNTSERLGLKKALNAMSKDGFGKENFAYTEFIAATFDRKKCIKEHLCKACFSAFDQDCDGKLSYQELAGSTLLADLTTKDLKKAFKEWDLNKDGDIDFQEFMAMIRKTKETDTKKHKDSSPTKETDAKKFKDSSQTSLS